MSNNKNDSLNCNIISNYCKYLNKRVILKTLKSRHSGSLKCIDPLTQSVALICKDNDSNASKVVIAMSHSIRSIELVDDQDLNCDNNSDDLSFDLKQFLSTSMGDEMESKLSDEEMRQRKVDVMELLSENLIPVEQLDDGSLVIAYALTLTAPYYKQQCICSNEIVLGKIQTLLDSMPNN